MMPTGNRARRTAMLAGQALALLLLLVSPRSLLAPADTTTKAQDSKRPKTPKNVVRAEPVRIPGVEKQGHPAAPTPSDAVAKGFEAGVRRSSRIQSLPRKAFTQLTRPDYLRSDSPGNPQIPLSPPA